MMRLSISHRSAPVVPTHSFLFSSPVLILVHTHNWSISSTVFLLCVSLLSLSLVICKLDLFTYTHTHTHKYFGGPPFVSSRWKHVNLVHRILLINTTFIPRPLSFLKFTSHSFMSCHTSLWSNFTHHLLSTSTQISFHIHTYGGGSISFSYHSLHNICFGFSFQTNFLIIVSCGDSLLANKSHTCLYAYLFLLFFIGHSHTCTNDPTLSHIQLIFSSSNTHIQKSPLVFMSQHIHSCIISLTYTTNFLSHTYPHLLTPSPPRPSTTYKIKFWQFLIHFYSTTFPSFSFTLSPILSLITHTYTHCQSTFKKNHPFQTDRLLFLFFF